MLDARSAAAPRPGGGPVHRLVGRGLPRRPPHPRSNDAKSQAFRRGRALATGWRPRATGFARRTRSIRRRSRAAPIDLFDEIGAKALPVVFVPAGRLPHIRLGFWADHQPAHQRRDKLRFLTSGQLVGRGSPRLPCQPLRSWARPLRAFWPRVLPPGVGRPLRWCECGKRERSAVSGAAEVGRERWDHSGGSETNPARPGGSAYRRRLRGSAGAAPPRGALGCGAQGPPLSPFGQA